MKTQHLLICFILISGFNFPSKGKKIAIENIEIVKIEKHPFLVDHKKLLRIQYNDRILSQEKMFVDPGAGCISFLFEEKSEFILIECNGNWYSISKQKGKIKSIGWYWEKDLPSNYVGRYVRGVADKYEFIPESKISKESVYQYKSPD